MKTQTIQQFFKRFKNDEICLEHLFNIRFGQGYECPKCEREAKWYRIKAERAYSCQWCGNHLHPTVGTPFEASRTSLQLWFYAIYLFTVTRSGVSAKELQRQLGVTYKCAWRMGHEIRKHMGNIDGDSQLHGHVEVDEGFFGRTGRKRKTVVLGMVERGGRVKTEVLPEHYGPHIFPAISKHIRKTSTIHTDKAAIYTDVKRKGYYHQWEKHSTGHFNTNTLESYWARLKLSIKGTHIWVSPKHLDKYAAEFSYRFNRRQFPERMLSEMLEAFPAPLN